MILIGIIIGGSVMLIAIVVSSIFIYRKWKNSISPILQQPIYQNSETRINQSLEKTNKNEISNLNDGNFISILQKYNEKN